ncbi:zona pellucida glycoprotein 3a precursor [Silurus asotus]|uniref:Zona pellucida sperm-binding protein 3 n=1 Tax=Silurus asotus TaxID=30991 RepID=A0AAD5FVE5_SILAS|nr:zona pellucida glycoprotein 3a precursor [Silurus asotus]
MGFNQVRDGLLLLLAVSVTTAQWTSLENIKLSNPGQPPLQMNPGLTPQWLQSASQVGSPGYPSADQAQQVIQQQIKKLNWNFPAMPKIPTPPPLVHVDRYADPIPAQGVTVRCNETSVYVEVSKDVLGIDPTFTMASLTLGGCTPKSMDASSQVLIYESPLYGCKSRLTVTSDELVYIFTLGMSPVPIRGTPILRRADDWLSERTSNQYYLGELINIEASVLQFHHVPLRVLVDGCVATTVPDINAVPRYFFIENFGCLVDAKLTQSSSQFMPQTQANKLRFQLEAFGFQQGNSSLVYITCILKATAASSPADAEHKACSFSDNRYVLATFNGVVLMSCDR